MAQAANNLAFEVSFSDAKPNQPPTHIVKRMEETGKKEELSAEQVKAKLEAAAERKKEHELEKINKHEHRQQEVEERREQLNQKLAETQEHIKEKHDAAEQRRKAMEEERRAKLQEHLRKVEENPGKVDYSSCSIEELEAKLEAAQKRRTEHENTRLEKLATREQHAEDVRRRKQQLQQTENADA